MNPAAPMVYFKTFKSLSSSISYVVVRACIMYIFVCVPAVGHKAPAINRNRFESLHQGREAGQV